MSLDKSIQTLKKNLRREPVLAASTIALLTITFLTLQLFLFTAAGSSVILKFLEDKAQISVFFLDIKTEDQILALKKKLESDERIEEVKYVSKAGALEIFKEISKNEPALLESVESNPLPASLDVRAKKLVDLQKLSEEFAQIEGVDDIRFHKSVVDKYRQWSFAIKVAGLVLLLILLAISVTTVLTTVGITIHSKGIEVEILKLVGATDTYVKTPLLLQGMFYGFCAALSSTLVFLLLIPTLAPVSKSLFFGLPPSSNIFEFIYWTSIVDTGVETKFRLISVVSLLTINILAGAALGYLGGTAAIKRYLKY